MMPKIKNYSLDKSLREKIIPAIRLVAFDFDGVFTDNMVYVFESGLEAVRCSRSDGIGLRKLERAGIKPVIISTETNQVVAVRSQKLKVQYKYGCEDKCVVLNEMVKEMGLNLEQVAFVGNDINDLPCFSCVGFPIVVRDAHPDVISYARYKTKAKGGHGAVREICDLFEWVLTSNHI